MAVYPMATVSDRTEPMDEPESRSLCDTCGHVVLAVDRKHSRAGCLRVLTVCVAEHDEDGSDACDVILEPMHKCSSYDRAAWCE